MPRTALIDYMAHHYGPEHLVLAGAGKVEHERLIELAERLFRDLPAPAAHRPDDARYEGGERREERELEQAHLLLGLPAFSYRDDDFYALQVLSTMLGGGMSSRLFQEVRENRGPRLLGVLVRVLLRRHRRARIQAAPARRRRRSSSRWCATSS